MYDYIIFGFACVGFLCLSSLAAYGAVCLKHQLTPSQNKTPPKSVQSDNHVVETVDGKTYKLVAKAGDRVSAVRLDGIGFMLLNESMVKPQYVQVIRQFCSAQ